MRISGLLDPLALLGSACSRPSTTFSNSSEMTSARCVGQRDFRRANAKLACGFSSCAIVADAVGRGQCVAAGSSRLRDIADDAAPGVAAPGPGSARPRSPRALADGIAARREQLELELLGVGRNRVEPCLAFLECARQPTGGAFGVGCHCAASRARVVVVHDRFEVGIGVWLRQSTPLRRRGDERARPCHFQRRDSVAVASSRWAAAPCRARQPLVRTPLRDRHLGVSVLRGWGRLRRRPRSY